MAAEKQLARQDTDFAINPGNNNETSIKVTSEILGLFYDELPSETTRQNVTFFIYKEDFIIFPNVVLSIVYCQAPLVILVKKINE